MYKKLFLILMGQFFAKNTAMSFVDKSATTISLVHVFSILLSEVKVLLKKVVIVLPLAIFGTFLFIFVYLDLIEMVDNLRLDLRFSFLLNVFLLFLTSVLIIYFSKKNDLEPKNSNTVLKNVNEPSVNHIEYNPTDKQTSPSSQMLNHFLKGFNNSFNSKHKFNETYEDSKQRALV